MSVFYILICSDKHEAGFLSDIRKFFLETLPTFLRKVLAKVCGERIVKRLEDVYVYVVYKPNPIVQIVYALCAGGGFFIYVKYGFCHLPNAYVGSYHKITGTILMLTCYYTYYKACATDPGYISKSTEDS